MCGLPAMQSAPGRALSLASQLPPRSGQPVGVDRAAQAACESGFARDCRWRLAGPYRWQASSHPDLCSLSTLVWLCKQLVGAGLPAMQVVPDKVLLLASQLPPRPLQPVDAGMAAQAACGSGLARDGGYTVTAHSLRKPPPLVQPRLIARSAPRSAPVDHCHPAGWSNPGRGPSSLARPCRRSNTSRCSPPPLRSRH